jgi:hypothetical protein
MVQKTQETCLLDRYANWCVNAFEEFEEDQANGIALWTEPITARFGEFFDQALGSQFA